jgi:hypothetical protein
MATSVYFNNQNATSEQFLIEDLIIESIKNHGIDIYYLPRTSHSSTDELFGDDPGKYFDFAYKIDMYLETFNDFEGNQEFFSKFGLEIQKDARVAVARRTFEKFVGQDRALPKEGDLIYLPVQKKLMEIRFVEEEKNFFQAGKVQPYMYGLNLETFKYNGEVFNTGFSELDDLGNAIAFNVEYTMQAGGSGTYSANEVVYQGSSLAAATAKGYVASWSKPNLKLKIRNIKGTFQSNVAVIGNSNSASWILVNGDTQEDSSTFSDDNVLIENEAEGFLDFTETNPFGEP